MAVRDKYADIPALFLPLYPIGSNVTGPQMLKFIADDTPPNHPVRAALSHNNPVAAAKRLLGYACYAEAVPQAQRFVIVTLDARRSLFKVEGQFNKAAILATDSLFVSVQAAMKPFRSALNELDVVNVDELTAAEAADHAAKRKLVESRAKPVSDTYQLQVKTEWRESMRTLGIDAATADRLLNGLPEWQRVHRMLTVTSLG